MLSTSLLLTILSLSFVKSILTKTGSTKTSSTFKMLSTSLLLTILSLSFVKSQHVSLPRTPRDAECRTSDLRLIKDYFDKTTIIRNQYTTQPEYCHLRKDSANVSHPKIDLDSVIYLYTTLDYVNSYKYVNSEGPVIRDGFLSINNDELLPLFEIADIRRKHLSCHGSHAKFGEDVDEQMSLMGRRRTDGRGHLLAHSIGGTSRATNVIPMAVNIYLHPHFETTTELLEPLADWRSNEFWIRKFLKQNPDGRVVWKMAVQYEENVFLNPKQVKSYRPLSFSVQYTAFADPEDIHSAVYTSHNLTFLNDNYYTCKPRVISCHDKDDGRAPPNCDIQMSTKKTKIELKSASHINDKFPNSTDWEHSVFFSYVIRDNTFLYDENFLLPHNTYYYWDVHRISPLPFIRKATFYDYHKSYKYSFPFNMNGRQFMYSHCDKDNSWFIRELTTDEDAKFLGHVTDVSTWPESHLNCAPFTISGKQFFFSQWTNYSWFIRELLPDGKMGKEKSSGTWPQMYPVVLAYVKHSRHMLYAHNPKTTDWIVREVLPDGQMGLKLNSGRWSTGYHISLNIIFSRRQFMYALSTEQPYDWFIREFLPNGEIGSVINSGKEDACYHLACVATICEDIAKRNCTQYLIKINRDTNQFLCDSIHVGLG